MLLPSSFLMVSMRWESVFEPRVATHTACARHGHSPKSAEAIDGA